MRPAIAPTGPNTAPPTAAPATERSSAAIGETRVKDLDWRSWLEGPAMGKSSDPTSLSDDELVEAYAEFAHVFETSEHVGRANRLMGHFMPILDELRARSGGTFQMLRPLLEHAEPSVRYSAATHFSRIDHEAYERTMRPLAGRADEIGRKAQGSLLLDAHYQKVGYPEARQPSPPVARGLPKGTAMAV